MKPTIFFAIILFGITKNGLAQTKCDCNSSYKFIYQQLLNSKSYKKSSKEEKTKVDSLYYHTLQQIGENDEILVFECFSMAAQLVMLINDNHNTFETKSYPIEMASWNNDEVMKVFKESPEFNLFPFYPDNIDSLYQTLQKKESQEIEGIYQYGNHTKLLLVKELGVVNGYIYETALKPWSKGELMLRLLPHTEGRYKMLFGNPINKKLIYNFEKFEKGFLMQLKLKKVDITHEPYHQEIFDDKTYSLRQINDTVQYLKIGSFKSSEVGIEKTKQFTDSIRSNINSKLLVVDLRGNSGGYKSNAKYFDKLLDKYKGKLVFLVNFRTKSYAEVFTLKWKGKGNVTIAGINTAGVIAYGRNYPEKKVSDDGWILTHFTDMGGILYNKYENIGVEPDRYLDLTKDWIDQIIESPNR